MKPESIIVLCLYLFLIIALMAACVSVSPRIPAEIEVNLPELIRSAHCLSNTTRPQLYQKAQ